MIPEIEDLEIDDFEMEEEPSKTFKMIREQEVINGYIDEIEAVEQAIYMILNTERYKYIIYSMEYGFESEDLYGEPISYVCPELKRRITEALLQDDRILSVNDFKFDISKKKTVYVTFTVESIFGEIESEKVVNV